MGYVSLHENTFLLIGKPGSGKTTALQKLLLEEVRSARPLTILIELRRFQTSVLDIAYQFTKAHHLDISLELLERQLLRGNCLLLLDGPKRAAVQSGSSRLVCFPENI